jgi:glutamate synthase (NADPH/NADH) large chain
VTSSLALVHSRFSTNTLGAWPLAHPYRNIVHNGEINTLRGNLNWMRAREGDLEGHVFGEDIEKLRPVTSEDQSDTAVLDNVLELLVQGGRSLPHALRMLVPEAWEKNDALSPARRAWYDYHSTMVEPWDGPALIAFTDGESVGAILDRNGLRPCRYCVTTDQRLVMASEAGALEVDPSQVVRKDRLEPGQMFLADAATGTIRTDEEVFADLVDDRYAAWLREERVHLHDLVVDDAPPTRNGTAPDLTSLQRTFGYTIEHLRRLLEPMAEDGKDPVGAMGDDAPPAVLSSRNQTLFNYFKQLFAQVSNPPLDYIREDLVTSLAGHLGRQRNLLGETPAHCRQLRLESPILSEAEMAAIQGLDQPGLRTCTLDTTFAGDQSLAEAVHALQKQAEHGVRDGCEIIVLTDRATSSDRLAIPSLLAVSAVHHHLIRQQLRTRTSLVLESGQPCTVHHMCTLLGYGAEAICPYLAYATIHQLATTDPFNGSTEQALRNYRSALEDGVLKVMAKMGISTLDSYKGAQVFEAVGLQAELIDAYFCGTTSRIEGIGIDALEADVRERHRQAYKTDIAANLKLDQGGDLYWRRDGEFHQWNPHTIAALQRAVRTDDAAAYREFAEHINTQNAQLQTLRGLLDFDTAERDAISIDEVEPIEAIVQRFFSGSMSFGSLSPEAHETVAIAMNRLGGRAGSGEGGEPVDRFGTERTCQIKQVASGRFGVTINYLRNASDLEIKMAQGSKPGEGGHLPGGKVNELIARTRYTTPGVGLISPPPHHDIYSIEDLAQLIHDLKCANPQADVHVKLVSEAGIGVIAAGVSKAKADAVLISGHSGGTGASPKTSIKSAGLPWELGLAEAHQVLRANQLRSRIRVRADGGFKTGRDVAVAALLGAEEYGFGTSPLVALGCIMLRKCHCNTCSVGIATQDPELRKKFAGTPEHVIRYMRFVAQEVREIMAALGFRTMDEMIGRVDRLVPKSTDHAKAQHLDLSALLHDPDSPDGSRKTKEQNHKLDEQLDLVIIEQMTPALEEGASVHIRLPIRNRNRTVGAMASGVVADHCGLDGLPDDTVQVHFTGTAGQSFGAFLVRGLTFRLDGEANDYVGKGLSGGKIILRAPDAVSYAAEDNVIAGNVMLYGATSGEAYVNGRAGERFAVRNSGALAVVEGVGDHGCEYMTGGGVVVLGAIGRNFGAGMSGGEAYVLDASGDAARRVNHDMVDTEPLGDERDRRFLHRLVENHYTYTGSNKARRVLSRWDEYVDRFIKVMPHAYARVLKERMQQGEDLRVDLPPQPRQGDHLPSNGHALCPEKTIPMDS